MIQHQNWRSLAHRRSDKRLIMLYKINYFLVDITKTDRLIPPLRQSRNIHSLSSQIPQCLIWFHVFRFINCSIWIYGQIYHFKSLHYMYLPKTVPLKNTPSSDHDSGFVGLLQTSSRLSAMIRRYFPGVRSSFKYINNKHIFLFGRLSAIRKKNDFFKNVNSVNIII